MVIIIPIIPYFEGDKTPVITLKRILHKKYIF
jgi:hypothetical protein